MAPGSAQQRNERSARHLALCPAERTGYAWRMVYLASPLPRRLVVSQCPPWITRQDVHSRLKNAKSQRNKRSFICSEGEPTLLSIHTDKDVEIAAPLLTRKGAEKRLIARRRAEQVQTGYTWTTDGVRVIGGKAVVSCANGTSMAICRLLNHRKQAGKNGSNGKQVGEWTTYDQNGNVYKLTQMAKKGTK